MTPDKVEAALGVMNTMARGCANYADTCVGNKAAEWGAAVDQYEEALATLTSALAERERDAARLDWLEHNCVNVADDLGTGSQLYLGTYATAPLRQAIDAAMKDTDHAR